MASTWCIIKGATGLYLHAVADESRYLLSTMEVRNSAGVTIQVKKYVTACQVKIQACISSGSHGLADAQ